MIIKNVPSMGQVLGGTHTEKGIIKGQPLVLGVPLPRIPLIDFSYSM